MEKYGLKDAVRFLKPYTYAYRKHFLAFYTGWLAETVMVALLPKLLGIMLDEIIYQQDMTEFLRVSGVVVFLMLDSCILYYWLYAQHHYLMIMFTFQIKIKVFQKFFRMNSADLKKCKMGEITAVIQEYPGECMHFLIRGVIHQVNNVIMIAILVLFSFKIHFLAGTMMILLSGICSGITIFSGKKSRAASVIQKETYRKYVSWLYEMIENFLSIRLLSMQKTITEKFDDFSAELFRQRNRMNLLRTVSDQVIKGLFLFSRLSLFAGSLYMIRKNIMTIGTFTVLTAYFSMITNEIIRINQSWNDAQTRVGYIRKIQEFMNHAEETEGGKLQKGHFTGKIEMNNVCFSYGSGQILQNFSLRIKPGEKIAVTGSSGSGKSTLTELLAGMLAADSGEITFDGIETGEYSRKHLRKEIGIMFQDSFILPGSLKENLLLARPDASDTMLWKAIQDVELDAYVRNWPGKMDAQIGEVLSGGQKQRFALAQLCLWYPSIVILDEPTSALDAAAEEALISKCMDLFRDRTMLIVTHRSQVVKMCDRVVRIGE